MKKLLGLFVFVLGLQSTAAQGMEYVVKNPASMAAFVIGGTLVPPAVTYLLAMKKDTSTATSMQTTYESDDAFASRKKEDAVVAACAGFSQGLASLGAYYLVRKSSDTTRNVVPLIANFVVAALACAATSEHGKGDSFGSKAYKVAGNAVITSLFQIFGGVGLGATIVYVATGGK